MKDTVGGLEKQAGAMGFRCEGEQPVVQKGSFATHETIQQEFEPTESNVWIHLITCHTNTCCLLIRLEKGLLLLLSLKAVD